MATVTQRTTAVGVFNNHGDAQKAVRELRTAGFTDTDIGMASRNESTNDKTSNLAVGATAGAATGAGVGALWGLGVIAGMLPAIGPVIAGGTLAAILASAATGAAAAGVAGSLIGLGIPEDEAGHYEAEFQAGRTLVTVKTPANCYDTAVQILNQCGAAAERNA